jgi:hypothetical protein
MSEMSTSPTPDVKQILLNSNMEAGIFFSSPRSRRPTRDHPTATIRKRIDNIIIIIIIIVIVITRSVALCTRSRFLSSGTERFSSLIDGIFFFFSRLTIKYTVTHGVDSVYYIFHHRRSITITLLASLLPQPFVLGVRGRFDNDLLFHIVLLTLNAVKT